MAKASFARSPTLPFLTSFCHHLVAFRAKILERTTFMMEQRGPWGLVDENLSPGCSTKAEQMGGIGEATGAYGGKQCEARCKGNMDKGVQVGSEWSE